MKPENANRPSDHESQIESPSEAVLARRSSGFPMLFSLVLGVCLLVMLLRDPAESRDLRNELIQMRRVRDEQRLRTDTEIRDLQKTVLDLQQTLRDAQETLKETQHALGEARKANDELVAAGRVLPAAGTPPPKVETRPAAPAVAAPPETAAERTSRAFKDLGAVVDAIRANASEYVNLTKALAETKRSLALAKGAAPADAAGAAKAVTGSVAEWTQDDLLNPEELATRDAAAKDAAIALTADASDFAAINREMSRLVRVLAQAQRRLGDGQKQLGALQEELRAALANPAR